MSVESVPLTREGHNVLTVELKRLKVEDRPSVIESIAEARSHGDLKENAEYHAARERQGLIEARIAELEDKLARAQVIENSDGEHNSDKVRFGAYVKLEDVDSGEEKEYRIVGDLEADIERNLLSISSPLAKALLGRMIGDPIEFKAPKGLREFEVVSIHY
ncbi:MAG: transcription elongation factor GreA [Oligoflexales bacterium]